MNPIPLVMVITVVLVFEAAYLLSEDEPEAFASAQQPDSPECDGVSSCIVAAWDAVTGLLGTIWSGVLFAGRLLSFDVAGAPWYVRVPVTVFFAGSGSWIVANLARGTRA